MSKRRDEDPGGTECAAISLLCLVLIYGMIALPLIVTCLPAGGGSLVELLGQDPCRHRLADAARSGAGDPADGRGLVTGAENPCRDLMLDNFGVTHIAVESQPSTSPRLEPLVPAVPVQRFFRSTPERLFFRLAREPASQWNRPSQPILSLRI